MAPAGAGGAGVVLFGSYAELAAAAPAVLDDAGILAAEGVRLFGWTGGHAADAPGYMRGFLQDKSSPNDVLQEMNARKLTGAFTRSANWFTKRLRERRERAAANGSARMLPVEKAVRPADPPPPLHPRVLADPACKGLAESDRQDISETLRLFEAAAIPNRRSRLDYRRKNKPENFDKAAALCPGLLDFMDEVPALKQAMR